MIVASTVTSIRRYKSKAERAGLVAPRSIAGEWEGTWYYTVGKFRGEKVIPEVHDDDLNSYYLWAVRAGAIPESVVKGSETLSAYHAHCLDNPPPPRHRAVRSASSFDDFFDLMDYENNYEPEFPAGGQMFSDPTEEDNLRWGHIDRSAGWIEDAFRALGTKF